MRKRAAAEPPPRAARPSDRTARGLPAPAAAVLAAGWLIIPALQYYATVCRTRIQVYEAPPGGWFTALDLTPVYAVLLAGTLVFAALRLMAARSTPATGDPDQETFP